MNQSLYEFSQSVIEQLGHYVYVLRDPFQDNKVFYIGKGTGNRVFSHVTDSLKTAAVSDKLDRIRAIHEKGEEVLLQIIRHGLTEKEAFEVEAALIDFEEIGSLSNLVKGHHSDERGVMHVRDIKARYASEPAEITVPSILIILNRAYRPGMQEEALYEFTRGRWKLGSRREKAKYAFAVYRGLIRQVYRIVKWYPVQGPLSEVRLAWMEENNITFHGKDRQRWEFEGTVAGELQDLIGKSVAHYQKKGQQTPFQYLNC
ncbi:MAG: hypothetical protein IPM21_08970 [Acidobacteria bacterium]|nr:hypothetical protein [Acidobacteriota bacterium]